MEVLKEFLKEYKKHKKDKNKQNKAIVKIGFWNIVPVILLVIGLCVSAFLSELYVLYRYQWMALFAVVFFVLAIASIIWLVILNTNSRSLDKAKMRIEGMSDTVHNFLQKKRMDNHAYIDLLLKEIDVYECRKESSIEWVKWLIPILLSVVLTCFSKMPLDTKNNSEQIILITITIIAMIGTLICVLVLIVNNELLQSERLLIDEVRSGLLIKKSNLDNADAQHLQKKEN